MRNLILPNRRLRLGADGRACVRSTAPWLVLSVKPRGEHHFAQLKKWAVGQVWMATLIVTEGRITVRMPSAWCGFTFSRAQCKHYIQLSPCGCSISSASTGLNTPPQLWTPLACSSYLHNGQTLLKPGILRVLLTTARSALCLWGRWCGEAGRGAMRAGMVSHIYKCFYNSCSSFLSFFFFLH